MIVGAVGVGLGFVPILLHQVADDIPALVEQTEKSWDELHLHFVTIGCAVMEPDGIVLVDSLDDVVEVLRIFGCLL